MRKSLIITLRRLMAMEGRMERVKGIEPSYAAWEAAVLPLNYTRDLREVILCWIVEVWQRLFVVMD